MNKSPILLSHANIFNAPRGCFEHSNLLKVNELEPHFTQYCDPFTFTFSFTQKLQRRAILYKTMSCDTTPSSKGQSWVTSRKGLPL